MPCCNLSASPCRLAALTLEGEADEELGQETSTSFWTGAGTDPWSSAGAHTGLILGEEIWLNPFFPKAEVKYHQEKVPSLSWFPSLNGPDEPPSWSSWWTAGRKSPHHHQARETLYPPPSGPSPDFWTCSPCVSHWHISPNPWPSNPLPEKICKTHKYCHENKHPNKPWFYSFGNEYGCPLPRAWTVLTSLLADPLGGLLVEKILIIIELKKHCILVHLGPLLTSGLALLVSLIGTPRPIHGPVASSCKDMQNPQVISREQTPKQALILQFWQWVWLSPSPSWNGPDEPPCRSSWWTAGRKKSSSSSSSRDTVSSSIWALSRLLDLLSMRLSLAHLAQSVALQSSSCKDMQNPQVLSQEQTHKQALILQFWQWVWLSPSASLNGPDEPPCWSSWWTAGRRNPHHHRAKETLYPRPSGPSPDFRTCSPCVSHWHTSPNLWPSYLLPAKICKTHKCCHKNKHPNKPWFYSFDNGYGCPLPRAWTVLTSLLADLLGGLLVKKILIIGLKRHCILVHLGPLPTSGLALLGSLIGTPHPIYGPPILVLQKYAKLTSVVPRTNTQTRLDSTVLAMSMVVSFPA